MFDRTDGLEFLKLAVETEFNKRRNNIIEQAEEAHKKQLKEKITYQQYLDICAGLKSQLKDLEELHAVAKALVGEMSGAA